MRRRLGFPLFVLGLVAVVVGTASGCGTFFSYNGRHPVAVQDLVFGTPIRQTFPAKHGMRYTLAVHVVFDRDEAPEQGGRLVAEARFPLVASIEDSSGVAVAKAVGWIDPNEPPTVLYGSDVKSNQRRPAGVDPAELVAERLVGAITVPRDREVTYAVDLGTDRVGTAHLKGARAVLYDDKLPTSIAIAFTAAGAGLIAMTLGSGMLVLGFFQRRRRGHARRGGAAPNPIV